MKLKIKNLKLKIWSGGYTLVEILVVLSIMSIFGVMAIYGIRNMNSSQSVTDAQRNFISDLRATQNKVLNGADGENFKTVNTSSLVLPPNVTVSPLGLTICFNNPNFTSTSCTNTFPINVSFTNGSTSKIVTIEGSGIMVNRIYGN